MTDVEQLTAEQVIARVVDLRLDEPDLRISREGDRFLVRRNETGSCVEDIGSSFEVPDGVGEHGRNSFTAGPWIAYLYHPSYVAVRPDNFEAELSDLAAGDIAALVVGVTAVDDAWVFAVRSIDGEG